MNLEIVFVVFCALFFCQSNAGPFKALLYSDYITCDHNKSLDLDVSGVQIYFYDFSNNINLTFPITDAAQQLTRAYNLDVTRRLTFFIPGYKSNIMKKTEELVRQTFKDMPNTYLMIVDHSAYTSAQGGKIKSYERSVMYAYYIGRVVAQFLVDLKMKGYPAKNMHCIGHSLGSQMLGYGGSYFYNKTGEKIWRITGIDPAGPCFSNSFIEDQIRSGVAEYVEVYHCNAGRLGTTSVLADTDFFFNKEGKNQPHCSGSIIPGVGESDAAKCSHKECVKFWTNTVHHPGWYLAWKCDHYKEFSKGKCAGNQVTIAGYSNPGNATGVFYVSTDGYTE